MKHRHILIRTAAALLTAGTLLAAPVQARTNVDIGIGIGIPGPVVVQPAPVVVQPAPVIVAPAPRPGYVWVEGGWVQAPRPYWREGYWRRAEYRPAPPPWVYERHRYYDGYREGYRRGRHDDDDGHRHRGRDWDD
ncbi:YXWGXW repeat-containing protein [Jeongeupia chitinilytica]|uniref:Uncharacterized protein n=1 Tax=Jeongeupia chitinilytica TaxID=1041641 RepID=A0ABQ3GZQ3_9NEIS|nr:YXWGXW repeat-containing protein [Jeongeupia chitinilytica]GHD63178.1 hypothetical protein GCM10007350_20100 [Jeongeupia chitinilytica]